jgi:hypothetical protein
MLGGLSREEPKNSCDKHHNRPNFWLMQFQFGIRKNSSTKGSARASSQGPDGSSMERCLVGREIDDHHPLGFLCRTFKLPFPHGRDRTLFKHRAAAHGSCGGDRTVGSDDDLQFHPAGQVQFLGQRGNGWDRSGDDSSRKFLRPKWRREERRDEAHQTKRKPPRLAGEGAIEPGHGQTQDTSLFLHPCPGSRSCLRGRVWQPMARSRWQEVSKSYCMYRGRTSLTLQEGISVA